MNRVLDADRSSGLVTVQAGITLHELGACAWPSWGWRWRTRATSTPRRWRGPISTATHGTGAAYRNISSQVEGVRLVTASGGVLDIGGDDPDLLGAARVGAGRAGSSQRGDPAAVPIFTLSAEIRRCRSAPSWTTSTAMPSAPTTSSCTCSPTPTSRSSDVHAQRPRARARQRQGRGGAGTAGGERRAGGAGRGDRPPAAGDPATEPDADPGLSPSVKVDRSHRVYATRRDVRFTEMEYAIPREHGPDACAACWRPSSGARCRWPSRSRCAWSSATTRPCRLPTAATASTSRCTSSAARSSRPTSARWRPSWTPTAAAPLGQAPLPVGRHAGPALPGVGRLPGRTPAPRPRAAFANDYTRRVLGD